MPTPLLSSKSPHEVMFTSKPNYSQLRIFGSLCFGRNHNIKHKFDQRAKRGIFVGYPFAQKGYRVFDIASKIIYTSRDVTFYEGVFPYHDLPHFSTSPPPVIPLAIPDAPIFDFPSPLPIAPTITHCTPSITPGVPLPTESPPDATLHPTPPVARPSRIRRQPPHLADYQCSTASHERPLSSSASTLTGTPYPLHNYISNSNLSVAHRAFLSTLCSTDEPRTFSQVILSPHWKEAMAT